MSVPGIIPALTGNVDKDALRAALVGDFIAFLDAAVDPETFDPADADTGAVIPVIGWQEAFYWLDASDSTTEHDGVTCLVTIGARRYKLSGSVKVGAVISRTVTTPPSTPVFGDAYLVPAASTGDWAAHQDDRAIWTSRGWHYVAPDFGPPLYIRDEDAFVRWTDDGVWSNGVGLLLASANTIPKSAAINWGDRVKVENQTTNAPPASPTVGNAYVIGPSPTGAWAGKSKQVALCEADGQWTYYIPSDGALVYDKSLKADYRYDSASTSWVSQAGAIVNSKAVFTASGSLDSVTGSGTYTYNSATAPVLTTRRVRDAVPLVYRAKKTGARLRFFYLQNDIGANLQVYALYRDSETTAIAWSKTGGATQDSVIFEISASDAAEHTYYMVFHETGAGAANSVTRRLFSVDEYA